MVDEGLEVTIAEKKGDAILDAPRRDKCVTRLANGYATSPQEAIISRRLDPDATVPNLDQLKRTEHTQRPIEIAIAGEALKDLGQNNVTNQNRLLAQQFIQKIGLRRSLTPEVIDPNARIYEDHPSVRMSFRSPDQAIDPRSERMSA
jgi:hypothetical protein